MEFAQFPSQGDLLKFVYNATGIIPSKNQFIIDVNVQPKSINKSLTRLAKEEGDFLKSFNNHITELKSSIIALFSETRFSDAIYDSLIEIFECYTNIVLTQHTYLTKPESLMFLVHTTLIQRFVISSFKHFRSYFELFNKLPSPKNNFWFLETKKYPFSYIIEWILETENIDYKSIYSDELALNNKDVHTLIEQVEKDKNNLNGWITNKVKLPPFSNVLDLFNRLFRHKNISDLEKDNYIFYLLIARFSTYVLINFEKQFGIEELNNVCRKLKNYTQCIHEDFYVFESIIPSSFSYPKEDKEMFNFWKVDFFIEKLEMIITKANLNQTLKFPIHIFKDLNDYLSFNRADKYIENISCSIAGYDILADKKPYDDMWKVQYIETQTNKLYPWLGDWLEGIKFYNNNQLEKSINSMDRAFQTIRYCAGNKQQQFIEDYLFISLASPEGWKHYKKSYNWCVFMNHFGFFNDFYNIQDNQELKTQFFEQKKLYEQLKSKEANRKTLKTIIFKGLFSS